jgi:hypothetical protein
LISPSRCEVKYLQSKNVFQTLHNKRPPREAFRKQQGTSPLLLLHTTKTNIKQWVAGTGPALEVQNPKDESLISKDLHSASANDVDIAVDYATEAFETGAWSTFTGEARGRCLGKLADLIEEHADEIAYFESIASGRPLKATRMDIPRFATVFRCGFPPLCSFESSGGNWS